MYTAIEVTSKSALWDICVLHINNTDLRLVCPGSYFQIQHRRCTNISVLTCYIFLFVSCPGCLCGNKISTETRIMRASCMHTTAMNSFSLSLPIHISTSSIRLLQKNIIKFLPQVCKVHGVSLVENLW